MDVMSLQGKKLLIMGGAAPHRKLVEVAKEMGVYTVVADYYETSDAKAIADRGYQINVMDVDALATMCKEEKIDGVLASHLDPCQIPYYELCHRLNVPCFVDTWEQVHTLTSKQVFKECCVRNGMDIIQAFDEDHLSEIEYPAFVKPVHSRGSRGQKVCHDEAELLAALAEAKAASDDGKAIIEKFMGDCPDFTVTYFVADGEIFLERTADRYLGRLELGLERVGTGTVSPSRFNDMYMANVDEKVRNMIRSLGIKNGPVFLQGFVDGNTVRFYDPGFRFPGCLHEYAMTAATDIEIIKPLIEFALTGKMTLESGKAYKDMYKMNGKTSINLFPILRDGVIGKIEGVEDILQQPWLKAFGPRYEVGETVVFTHDIRQWSCEITVLADTPTQLAEYIRYVQQKLHYVDVNGNDMMIEPFNTDLLNTL